MTKSCCWWARPTPTSERTNGSTRSTSTGRHIKHFAFGAGVHKCLGMHLAGIELRTAMRLWHERIPEYHIPDGVELQWAPVMRQVMELPLVFDKIVS